MRWISLFSGAGCGDLGLHRAGDEIVAMVEWDKYASSVAKYNFPNVPIYSDVQQLDPNDLPDADGLIYSFPCQDLSRAGKQKGFKGKRSTLYEHAIRIIQHLRTRGLRYSLAENVVGLQTSNNGDDFARLINDLLNVRHNSIGWTILDSRYVGFSFSQDRRSEPRGIRQAVPQRRRRIFILGAFGDISGESIAEILSFKERCKGYINESQRKRKIEENASSFKGESSKVCKYINRGVDVYNGLETGETASTLTTAVGGMHGSGPKVAVSWNGDVTPKSSIDLCMTLRSQQGGEGVGVAYKEGIRRLTPIECERLQGLPDDFTKYGSNLRLDSNKWILDDGINEISDNQRYKILGNAITSHCTEWIARRIKEYEKKQRRT
jgi:DNA (cytosine-5)-methyltransferase 1